LFYKNYHILSIINLRKIVQFRANITVVLQFDEELQTMPCRCLLIASGFSYYQIIRSA